MRCHRAEIARCEARRGVPGIEQDLVLLWALALQHFPTGDSVMLMNNLWAHTGEFSFLGLFMGFLEETITKQHSSRSLGLARIQPSLFPSLVSHQEALYFLQTNNLSKKEEEAVEDSSTSLA